MRKHAHYFRSVAHLAEVDIYRILDLFGVTDQALGHAIKKLVVPGMRGGGKPARKDIEEAIDTLQRKLEMMDEDAGLVPVADPIQPSTGNVVEAKWIKNTGEFALPPLVRAGIPTEIMFRNGEVRVTSAPEVLGWGLPGSAHDIVNWRFAAKVAVNGG